MAFALFLLSLSAPAAVYAASTSSTTSTISTSTISPTVILDFKAAGPTCGSSNPLCPIGVTDAYNVTLLHNEGVNGTGQTVVIDDACGSSTIASDLETFDAAFNLPNPTLNVIYQNKDHTCVNGDWALETSLDVEWSHVMAPGATIDLLVAAQPNGHLFKEWNYALDNSLGNQISNSWGGGGGCVALIKNILATATADHVTILASAGDGGYWGEGTPNEQQEPADCQQVLTVGGTQLALNSTGNGYGSEEAWTDSGGGYVPHTVEPAYQKFAKINDSYGVLGKADVSAVASCGSPVWVYDSGNGGWSAVCGTSVSCPMWAGFMADVNQVRAANGFKAAGFVQPFLYKDVYGASGKGSLYSKDFHDVTKGSNGWPAEKGWDPPTGLGSMNGAELAHTLGDSNAA